MGEEKLYVGAKIIRAIRMNEISFLENIKGVNPEANENREDRAGYKVTYPDGYVSWSPKGTFENAYREVTDSEKAMI